LGGWFSCGSGSFRGGSSVRRGQKPARVVALRLHDWPPVCCGRVVLVLDGSRAARRGGVPGTRQRGRTLCLPRGRRLGIRKRRGRRGAHVDLTARGGGERDAESRPSWATERRHFDRNSEEKSNGTSRSLRRYRGEVVPRPPTPAAGGPAGDSYSVARTLGRASSGGRLAPGAAHARGGERRPGAAERRTRRTARIGKVVRCARAVATRPMPGAMGMRNLPFVAALIWILQGTIPKVPWSSSWGKTELGCTPTKAVPDYIYARKKKERI